MGSVVKGFTFGSVQMHLLLQQEGYNFNHLVIQRLGAWFMQQLPVRSLTDLLGTGG